MADPIVLKYASLGGLSGFLGAPVTSEQWCPDGIGEYEHFQNGSIYWSPSTGAHEVHGAIRDEWASLGWEKSVLGYPITDESGCPDGVGRYNHFQNDGSIYWSPSTGAHEVHGPIRDKWASLDWEKSFLGYPVTDEWWCPDGVGRYNHFQNNGSIYWTPTTGAHEIHGLIRTKWASMGWEKSPYGYPTSDEQNTSDIWHPLDRMELFVNGKIVYEPVVNGGPWILSVYWLNYDSVRFTWDFPGSPDGVLVRYGLAGNPDGETQVEADIGGSSGSYDVGGLSAGSTYTFSVDPFATLAWPYGNDYLGWGDPILYTMTW
jgi:uncharacterized protein with LGFP repeats